MRVPVRRDPVVVGRAMRRVRSRNTAPEMALRRALWHRGFRYRIDSELPGKPDIVFPRAKVVVFVDGDFWHGRQWMSRGFSSIEEQMSRVNNGSYWVAKIRRNMERDHRVTEQLEQAGWRVVRLWASDIEADPDRCAAELAEMLPGGRA